MRLYSTEFMFCFFFQKSLTFLFIVPIEAIVHIRSVYSNAVTTHSLTFDLIIIFISVPSLSRGISHAPSDY